MPRSARCSSSTRLTCLSTRPASSQEHAGSKVASATPLSSSVQLCRPTSTRASAPRQNFGIEVDAMPGGFVCSASMKRRSSGQGRRRLDVRRETAAQALQQGAARVLRRARARRARHRRPVHPRPDLRAEAEGCAARLLTRHSSRRCGYTRTARGSSSCPRSASRVRPSRLPSRFASTWRARAPTWAVSRQTKTKTALEFFSAELQAEAKGAP